jgi:cell division protease FtsH
MSEALGPVTFGNRDENIFLGREFTTSQPHSELTASSIDTEIRGLIMRGYERAKSLLAANLRTLHAIAQALLEREVLDSSEIDDLVQTYGGGGGNDAMPATA